MVDGRPRYVTALGETDAPAGWRADKARGGIVMDVDTGEVIARGLSMPHSPRWYAGRLWVCESGAGTLGYHRPRDRQVRAGRRDARVHPRARLRRQPGVRRAVAGARVAPFSAAFRSPSGSPTDERTCGVCVIDLGRGEPVALLRFESAVQEVFAVQVLPGRRYPELINDDDEVARKLVRRARRGAGRRAGDSSRGNAAWPANAELAATASPRVRNSRSPLPLWRGSRWGIESQAS